MPAKDAFVSPTNPYGHNFCDTFNTVYIAVGPAHELSLLDKM